MEREYRGFKCGVYWRIYTRTEDVLKKIVQIYFAIQQCRIMVIRFSLNAGYAGGFVLERNMIQIYKTIKQRTIMAIQQCLFNFHSGKGDEEAKQGRKKEEIREKKA
eukprot:TRINITY_DN77825_c0_g2_i1.p3 TRINITY_DN77825_c0_g2~~TRINITY_DN77825_c0_g2_i1.p3  ORF type:complete len:106 (-),score=10.47 TRINITY_DN77825_c0_g2_i1:109-426(-)